MWLTELIKITSTAPSIAQLHIWLGPEAELAKIVLKAARQLSLILQTKTKNQMFFYDSLRCLAHLWGC